MEDAAEQLKRLAQSVGECILCEEIVAHRLRAVPGGGHPHCAVMVVSLQPDPIDEAEGKTAGSTVVAQLSEFIPALAQASDRLYVTTLLKCVARDRDAVAPRQPDPAELDACFPYLSREISITTPHFILTVGQQTTRYVLRRLFKDLPYDEEDSLELRVFDNPAFRVVPVATPDELRARDAKARKEYSDRFKALAQVIGL